MTISGDFVLKLSLFILLTGFLFSGCTTLVSQNSPSIFSGKFRCPGYKGNDNKWEASEDIVEHKIVNGVDILVVDYQGKLLDKTGPYKKTIMIADGKWRYSPFYRNKTVYPIKVKTELKGNKITWQAEYPEFIDNKGKKRSAAKGKGVISIDENGDQISTGSHYTGAIKCSRIK